MKVVKVVLISISLLIGLGTLINMYRGHYEPLGFVIALGLFIAGLGVPVKKGV